MITVESVVNANEKNLNFKEGSVTRTAIFVLICAIQIDVYCTLLYFTENISRKRSATKHKKAYKYEKTFENVR